MILALAFITYIRTSEAQLKRGILPVFSRKDMCLLSLTTTANRKRIGYTTRNHTSIAGMSLALKDLIKSDRIDDPEFRTVSNEGFEGLGFMTANLFIRAEIFHAINGFDEIFDNPHFREDTDLAWRALEYGEIPFARDVEVFHPPHKRSLHRESREERNKFFEKDALLMKKHPERYKELFLAECHWHKLPEFCKIFLNSANKYGMELPEWCRPYIEKGLQKTRTRLN